MRTRSLTAVLSALALSAALAACGGSGDDQSHAATASGGDSTTTAPAASDQSVDEACAALKTAFDQIEDTMEAVDSSSQSDIENAMPTILQQISSAGDDVTNPEVKAAWQAYADNVDDFISLMQEALDDVGTVDDLDYTDEQAMSDYQAKMEGYTARMEAISDKLDATQTNVEALCPALADDAGELDSLESGSGN